MGHHLPFPLGQHLHWIGLRRFLLADAGHQRGGVRVEQRASRGGLAHRVDDLRARGFFAQEPVGAGRGGADDGLLVVELGEHHTPRLGPSGAELAAQLDTVAVG